MASAGKAEEEESGESHCSTVGRSILTSHGAAARIRTPRLWALSLSTAVPTGVVIMSNVFIQVAILELRIATLDAAIRIDAEDDDPPTCKGRSHGMRPANVYNTVATAGALSVAVLLPIVGAVVENSRFRKRSRSRPCSC